METSHVKKIGGVKVVIRTNEASVSFHPGFPKNVRHKCKYLEHPMDSGQFLSDLPLEFLWIELTNKCNLRCIHCYANSSPTAEDARLKESDYLGLLKESADLGCRKVQFIGGEPTLNPSLPRLIKYARSCGMDFVEVYTNARHLSESLIACFVEHKVDIAISFYSHDPAIHDAITQSPGSQFATTYNLHKLAHQGLSVRVGIIKMPLNEDSIPVTVRYIHDLGVKNCGVDRTRGFGRAMSDDGGGTTPIEELCGSCWQGTLCVHPDGEVSPCIMSRAWTVGSILETPLSRILESRILRDVRRKIYREVWLPANSPSTTARAISEQIGACSPECNPTCGPRCSPSCQPCWPFGKCRPRSG